VVHRLNTLDQAREEELLQVRRKHTVQFDRVGTDYSGREPLGRKAGERLTEMWSTTKPCSIPLPHLDIG
jgi:hypothetical protein